MARDWHSFGTQVQKRRADLGFKTAKGFAEHAGVSSETIRNIENGYRTGYSAGIIAAVEYALGWAQGSFMAVVDGAKPRLKKDPLFDRVRLAWPHLDDQSKRMFVEVVEATLRKR